MENNRKSQLIALKIGQVKVTEPNFTAFLLKGFTTHEKLRFLYITTDLATHKAVTDVNNNFLPKIVYATFEPDVKINTEKLLDLMADKFESETY